MRDFLEWTRDSARELVEEFAPDELAFFKRIWTALEEELAGWHGRPPGRRGVGRYMRRAMSALGPGVRVRGRGLMTPSVVAVLLSSVLELAGREEVSRDEVERAVASNIGRFGLAAGSARKERRLREALSEIVRLELEGVRGVGVVVPADAGTQYRIVTHERAEPLLLDAAGLRRWHERNETGEREGKKRKKYRIIIDETRGRVVLDGRRVDMPPISRRALRVLIEHAGSVVTHGDLYTAVTEGEYWAGDSERGTIHRWISDLRGASEKLDGWVEGIWGVGYRWAGPSSYCVIAFADAGHG